MINLIIIYDVVNIFSMKSYKSLRNLRVGMNKPYQHFEYACMKKLSLLPFRDKQIYVDLNQKVIFTL